MLFLTDYQCVFWPDLLEASRQNRTDTETIAAHHEPPTEFHALRGTFASCVSCCTRMCTRIPALVKLNQTKTQSSVQMIHRQMNSLKPLRQNQKEAMIISHISPQLRKTQSFLVLAAHPSWYANHFPPTTT